MLVQEIMSRPVVTVDEDRTVLELDRLFQAQHFHHVVVVSGGRPVGVVSDRDVLKYVSPFLGSMSERLQDELLLKRRAHQVMTRQPVMVTPETTVAEAGRLMREKGVSCLPVVERTEDGGERVVGIVTLRDVANWAVTELERRVHAEAA